MIDPDYGLNNSLPISQKMIFVTVGTDMPFDRLIQAVEAWAQKNDRCDVFAQIGEGGWKPKYLEFQEFLEPLEFKQRFEAADVIVAHAGMGTILSALHAGKPILIMPRKASLGEQRNEHQLATAKRMKELGLISVVQEKKNLVRKLDELSKIAARPRISCFASAGLVEGLSSFIQRS